jgi:hypothetical protein
VRTPSTIGLKKIISYIKTNITATVLLAQRLDPIPRDKLDTKSFHLYNCLSSKAGGSIAIKPKKTKLTGL